MMRRFLHLALIVLAAGAGAAWAKEPAKVVGPDPARTPPVVITRVPDSGAAVIANPPLPGITEKAIMSPAPAVRQTPAPFFKLTIPDPDDRANRPTLPIARDAMPPIPTAPPSKPGL